MSFAFHWDWLFCDSGVKVSPRNANLFYTGSLDQTLKLWDLRTGSVQKPVSVFHEERAALNFGKEKPLTTFDVNCDDRFIAAGTEQVSIMLAALCE